MANKYLDENGLLYFWQKIKNKFVAKETGKGLSTNDFTTAEKTKLSGIETGAEVNVIESIALNGTAQTVTNKAVDLELVTSVNGQTGDVIVEGGEGGGGTSNNFVTLWTGSMSTMGATSITLSESADDFDFLICYASYWGTGFGSNVILRTSGTTNMLVANGNSNAEFAKRVATVNGTTISFSNGRWINGGSQDNSSSACIPQAVYGVRIKGVGKSGQLELAWSNPSPTASFAPQTITLKDSYPVVFVVSTYSASDDITSKNGTVSTIISGYRGQVIAWNENMTWTYGRSCALNGSSLTVGDARWLIQSSSASAIQNDTCIPKFVFGLKTVAPKVGKTLLWTNPSPTANFDAQTITLANDANQYDMLMVESRYGATEDSISSSFLEPTVTTRQTVMSARYVVNATTTIVMRDATINGTQITFTTGRYIVPNGMGEGTQYAIPLKIYGINFSGTPSTPEYRSGDEETVVSTTSGELYALIVGGFMTDSSTRMYFNVHLPYSMANVTPSITSLRMNVRHVGGGYATSSSYVSGGLQVVGVSGYTVNCNKINDYDLTIGITHSSFNGTSNTPVGLEVDELIISFS